MRASVKSLLTRLAASTFVLTIVLLVGFDLFISTVRPLRYFNATGFTPLDQNPVVSKLPEFLTSHAKPDVILLGSSLMLVPAVRCDDELEGRRTRYDPWYGRNHINEYTRAHYLETVLSKCLGRHVSIINLGVVASMMSDHYLIFKKALAAGKRPGLVICGIAPRDFLDNFRSQIDKTPVYQVLADVTCLQELIDRGLPFDQMRDFVIGNVWRFYKVKVDYRTFLQVWASQAAGHPLNLHQAANWREKTAAAAETARHPEDSEMLDVAVVDARVKPDYTPRPNTLDDLDLYRHVYIPVNEKLFEQQTAYLEKMLRLSQESGVPVALVHVPLTKENKQVLPPEVLKRYRRTVKELAERYHAPVVDVDSMLGLELADFEDSCHMNARGGKKFYNALAGSLAQNRDIQVGLNGRGTLIGQRLRAPVR